MTYDWIDYTVVGVFSLALLGVVCWLAHKYDICDDCGGWDI